ncbi:SNF2 family N-terminal domain-containing protein [Diaporthe sp. PMI_573]|nr:SNF2 family N-terminal domain-containing protein [Diaporthaceae sp. PMI_573]
MSQINTFDATVLRNLEAPTRLQAGPRGTVHQYGDGVYCGTLASNDEKLLQLFVNEGLEYDLHWIPEKKPTGAVGVIWATIYGCRQIAEDLGETLQQLDMFLQDPIYAEQDVIYWNPHKFKNDDGLRTNHLKVARQFFIHTQNSHDLGTTDFLNKFVSEDNLPETEGSAFLRTRLKSHQKRGLTFMIRREQGWQLNTPRGDIWTLFTNSIPDFVSYCNNIANCKEYSAPAIFRGGILSDQMGLGKSLSMLALIANDKGQRGTSPETQGYTTLIVVPPQLLASWELEIEKHIFPDSFSWYCHHGPSRYGGVDSIWHYDLVITTYSTLAREWQKDGQQAALCRNHWHRVVLDEAHCIKDINSVTAQATLALKAIRRWAVTGTPVQNGLSDMFSLFRFIQVYPYSERSCFDEQIVTPWTKGSRDDAIKRLKKLLQYIMLRRPGTIITLPKRTDTVYFLRFDAQERVRYQQLAQATIHYLDDILNSNATAGGHKNAVTKINALRMACNLGCQRRSSLHDSFDPPDLTPGPSSVFEVLASGPEVMECSETAALLGICRVCGVPISNSEFLSPDDSGDCGTQLWCSLCLLDLADPTEEGSDSDVTSLQNVSTKASVAEEKHWPTKICALLEDIQSQDGNTKCIIFSSWTSTLDLADAALSQSGMRCLRFDGKTPNKQRKGILQQFSDPNGPAVLLMSLQCGAVGLNLTAASRAYLMEPHWNPTIEEQALARIHRLGQTRDVVTIRLVMEDSIEQASIS